MRRGFKPPLRKVLGANAAFHDAMKPQSRLQPGDPNYIDEMLRLERWRQQQATNERAIAALPKQRGPVVNRSAPEELESGVIRAVSELLAVHPKVAIALRMNSGAASYEAKTGVYAPVWFHKWLRVPGREKMKMPDFQGWLTDGRVFALEAKRPAWQHPRDEREHAQERFLAWMRAHGGIGAFVRSATEAQQAIEA